MYSNKGVVKDALTWLILGVIFLAIIFLAIKNFGSYLSLFVEENECRKEVMTHAFSLKTTEQAGKTPGGSFLITEIASDIKCSTKFKNAGRDSEKALAEEMTSCWDTWGKGQWDLFAEEEGAFCHVCSVLEFREDETIPGDEFYQYLATNPGKESYLQKMIPFSTQEIGGIEDSITGSTAEFPDIDTSERHAIIFKYIKGQEKIIGDLQRETAKQTMSIAIGAGGAVLGAKIGASVAGLACSGVPLVGTFVCGAGGAVVGAGVGLVYYVMSDEPGQVFSYVSVTPYTQEALEASGCEELPAQRSQKN